jgi:hypothetical protein
MLVRPMIALALALCAAPVTQAACGATVIDYRAPETRQWIAGHYEWVNGQYSYVSGHWLVTPACQTIVYDQPSLRPVVYAQPCQPTVVYAAPPCRPAPCQPVVYTRPCAPVVYQPERCSYQRPVVVRESHQPRSRVEFRATLPLLPPLLPVPFPVPFGRIR